MAFLSSFCPVCLAASVLLDGAWTLEYRRERSDDGWASVRAEVPGNVEMDLVRAGLIPEPEKGTNVWALESLRLNEWRYSRRFPAPARGADERVRLCFEGVDTRASVFLNGERIGDVANMFIPHAFDVTDRLKAENELVVHIHSPVGAPQLGQLGRVMMGMTDGQHLRKAAHMWGWDIMPRLVSAGLWKSVRLDVLPPERIVDAAWTTLEIDRAKRTAKVVVDYNVRAPFSRLDVCKVRCRLSRNGKVAAEDIQPFRQLQDRCTFWEVGDADFWWPVGFGEAALYDASVELLDGSGDVLARDVRKFGIRLVRLEREDIVEGRSAGRFRFVVNGEPCFIRGGNWTPCDALHSRDRLWRDRTLACVKDLGCNMLRVWGGGVYEPDSFYDWCDANGVLVWQDFMTACTIPPQNDGFAREIEEEARAVVLRLRSHPSLALWSGNNENDTTIEWGMGPNCKADPNAERMSREVIPRVVWELDPMRSYLPSSPYLSPEVVAGRAKCAEGHLWGPRGYYKAPYYRDADSLFVSEIGYSGMPCLETLKDYWSEAGRYPWVNRPPKGELFKWGDRRCLWHPDWICKSTTPFATADLTCGHNNIFMNHVTILFGEAADDLETFIEQSQSVQAEAHKYFVERMRLRKDRGAGGIIWWNVREGWPISSEALVDYAFRKKKAYWAVRGVQGEQLVAINDANELKAVNDTLADVSGRVCAKDVASGRVLFDGKCEMPSNGAVTLARLDLKGQGLVVIDYEFGGVRRRNRHLYGMPPFKWSDYRKWQEVSNEK